MPMLLAMRWVKACLGAVVIAGASFDLSGSALLAGLAALVPLGLGLSNLAPFAALGLPALVAAAAAGARLWPETGLDLAAAALWENADQVRTLILAGLQGRPQ
jgi:hypothetical protein